MKISKIINILSAPLLDAAINRILTRNGGHAYLTTEYADDLVSSIKTPGGHELILVTLTVSWSGDPKHITWAQIKTELNKDTHASKEPLEYCAQTLKLLAIHHLFISGRKCWDTTKRYVIKNADNPKILAKIRNAKYEAIVESNKYLLKEFAKPQDKLNVILADIGQNIFENHNSNIYYENSPLGVLGHEIMGFATVHRVSDKHVTLIDDETDAYINGIWTNPVILHNKVGYCCTIDGFDTKYSTTRVKHL